jgi:hypothetical protein
MFQPIEPVVDAGSRAVWLERMYERFTVQQLPQFREVHWLLVERQGPRWPIAGHDIFSGILYGRPVGPRFGGTPARTMSQNHSESIKGFDVVRCWTT